MTYKHMEVCQGLIQTFHLPGKEVTLPQTKPSQIREDSLETSQKLGDKFYRLMLVGLTVKSGVNASPLGDKLSL